MVTNKQGCEPCASLLVEQWAKQTFETDTPVHSHYIFLFVVASENILFFVEIGKALPLEYVGLDKRIRFMGIGSSASAEGI